jgi:HPt (histidine-containing phosphotransfer) domain-containing protein
MYANDIKYKGDLKMITIPGVNAESAIFLYGNEMDIYLTVLRSYMANMPASIEKIRVVTAENLPAYSIEMHSIKSASGSIGAEEAWEKALHLERMAKENNLAEVLKGNGLIIDELQQLVADIKTWLDEFDIGVVKPKLPIPDKGLLRDLISCCASYDMDGIDAIMNDLEAANYDEDEDLVKWLREKVDALDVPGVIARLNDYLGESL